jgi:hypothetical protein
MVPVVTVPSKESIAFSAQLECILDAFLSPPKHFGLTEILHGTSALGGDRFNNRFSKRRELSQSKITSYFKLPVLLVTHFLFAIYHSISSILSLISLLITEYFTHFTDQPFFFCFDV